MSTRSSRIALLALGLLGIHGVADAQDWAQKMFDHQKLDFGVVARGSDAVQELIVTNLYKETVHIASVTTTCGCSAAKPDQNTLLSRGVAKVTVTMDTKKFTGRKDSNVVVTFDKPFYAQVRVPVTAYIRTDVVLDPGSANFGAVAQGQASSRQIGITYAGRNDWTIRGVKSSDKNIVATVTETSRGNGRVDYTLTVSLKPSAPVGLLREQLILMTDDENAPRFPVLVEARVEADITVTPAQNYVGELAPRSRKTLNIVLRGNKAFEIEKVECKTKGAKFDVKFTDASRAVHVLPLTMTMPSDVGEFNEEFIVTIAGRPEPVRFTAYGKVIE
ncbi:MAG: DUF1573 domain-containing protein [Planctomycetota bacterium]|nr:DUF1573 domain-containing protein [Planctomycetota bacterium]